jgi:hypothetical protein
MLSQDRQDKFLCPGGLNLLAVESVMTNMQAVLLSLLLFLPTPFQIVSSDTLPSDIVTIDSPGMWTLDQLGYSNINFACQNEIESVDVHYILPETATQGPDVWYLVHLDLLAQFNEESDNGQVYVTALINGYASASVEFSLTRSADSLAVDWNTVDLINGLKKYSSLSNSADISFSNYIQVAGIDPGLGVLTFRVERSEGVKLKNLSILDTSGIQVSENPLPKLQLSVVPPPMNVKVGNSFNVAFQVSNVGGMPALDVSIQAIYPSEALQVIGENPLFVNPPQTELSGEFEFEVLQPGQHEIFLKVNTASGILRPSAHITIDASLNQKAFFPTLWVAVAICILILGFVVLMAAFRFRHQKLE